MIINKHYYGHSGDPEKRLRDHNNGRVRSTKAHKPWKIVHVEKFQTRTEASNREKFFKSIDGYSYLKSKGII